MALWTSCATKSTDRATALRKRWEREHFRITQGRNTTPMKTFTSHNDRKHYRPIEPSWVTLGQACLLIMMVVLVQF